MRKLLVFAFSLCLLVLFAGCGNNEGQQKQAANDVPLQGKTLVVYFSNTGHTKALAEKAAEILHADTYEIQPEIPYTAEDLDYNDESHRATNEQRDDTFRPAIKSPKIDNFAQYKNIVLAYPIWWEQAPRIVDAFVESYDWSDKTIIPMSTSEGSEIGTSADYLKTLAKDKGTWKAGKNFGDGSVSKEDLAKWLAETTAK